jgi:very-short-patch-repair endonuclease/ribosomal protein S27AE
MSTLSDHASNSNTPSSKYCSGCDQTLDITCFAKNRSRPDGLEFRCKECRNITKREFRKHHPDKPDTPAQHKARLERQQKKRSLIVTKVCIECGNSYQGRNGAGEICAECKPVRRQRFRPQTFLNCDYCGTSFLADHLNRKYCSYECKKLHQNGRSIASKGKKYPSKQRASTHVCPSCSGTFRATGNTKRYKQIYCSHACYLKERRVSHFEIRVMDLLESVGIPLDRQVRRGKWSFDGAISNTSILIEADGAYWHSSEKVKERDARKDKWCLDHGYILVRVPELEFYDNPMETIMPVITRWENHTGQTAQLIERVEEAANG